MDHRIVRQPKETEKTRMVDAMREKDNNLTVEDAFSAIEEASVAVFPFYLTSCVGYQGMVIVAVWGTDPKANTVFIEKQDKSLEIVSEQL